MLSRPPQHLQVSAPGESLHVPASCCYHEKPFATNQVKVREGWQNGAMSTRGFSTLPPTCGRPESPRRGPLFPCAWAERGRRAPPCDRGRGSRSWSHLAAGAGSGALAPANPRGVVTGTRSGGGGGARPATLRGARRRTTRRTRATTARGPIAGRPLSALPECPPPSTATPLPAAPPTPPVAAPTPIPPALGAHAACWHGHPWLPRVGAGGACFKCNPRS